MSVHVNIEGTWTDVVRPYVNRSGVNAPVKQVWVKRSGVWTIAYDYDVIPPPAPELTLTVIDGRYINVGTRSSAALDDPDLALIRVMVGGTKGYPSSQFGTGYISGADLTYPNEPWSDVRYNGYLGGTHTDTTVLIKKEYPLNVSSTYDLPGGVRYYFQAWAMDKHGNWSIGTPANILMPKTGDTDQIVKHARFTPVADGNIRSNVYYDEPPTVKNGQDAIFFYGGAMASAMRQQQPVVNVTSAQILLYRKNDSGTALANVYLCWHNRDTAGWSGSNAIHEITYIGQIAKGQAKWFYIPAGMIPDLASEAARGFAFYFRDPNKPQANPEDYMELYRFNDETGSITCGMIDMHWTESPS